MDPLNDDELKSLLERWKAPPAPESLEAGLLGEFRARAARRAAWRWIFATWRLPAPAVVAMVVLVIALAAAAIRRPAPHVIIQTRTVEVPVVRERVVTRIVHDRPAAPAPRHERAQATDLSGFQPVAVLSPRIIRNGNVDRN